MSTLYFPGHPFSFALPSAIPAAALNEEDEDEEDEDIGEDRDDERSGTRYNVSFTYFVYIDDFSPACTVCLVPHHLRYRSYVRRHAAHRLVRLLPPHPFPKVPLITMIFFQ